MPAVLNQRYVPNFEGTHGKQAATNTGLVTAVRGDFDNFLEAHDGTRLVLVWYGSIECPSTQ